MFSRKQIIAVTCVSQSQPGVTSARYHVLFCKLTLSHWIGKKITKQNIKYMTGNSLITLKGGLSWCNLPRKELFRVYHKSQIELYNQQISTKPPSSGTNLIANGLRLCYLIPHAFSACSAFYRYRKVCFKRLLAALRADYLVRF